MKKLLRPLQGLLPGWGRLSLYLALPYLPVLLLAWRNTWNVPELPSLSSPSSTPAPDPGVSGARPGGVHPSPGPTPGPARWELKALESAPWKLLLTDHFAIRGDSSARTLRDLGQRAEAVFDELCTRLGGDADGIRFSVRAFGNPHEFALLAAGAGVPDAASYYDASQAEAVLHWLPDLPHDQADRTLRHELAHLYMDRVFNLREPLWLCEGVAGWMEGGTAAVARESIPLRRLLRAGRDEFYGPDRIGDYYAESASLVRCLAAKPGLLERLLRGEPIDRVEELSTLKACWRGAETASK